MTSHLNEPAHGCLCFVVFNLLCDSDWIRCVPLGPKHIDDCRVRRWTRHRQVWHRTKGDAERLTMWRLYVTITESDIVCVLDTSLECNSLTLINNCVCVSSSWWDKRHFMLRLTKKTISFVNTFSVNTDRSPILPVTNCYSERWKSVRICF